MSETNGENMKVTFIGMGIMGSRMAANLIKNKVDVTIFNRTPGKTPELVKLGAKEASSLVEAVAEADVVFTMLSKPDAVLDMSNSFLSSMKKDALWVDSTTVGPDDSLTSENLAKNHGIRFLEAPVAGTKQPAESGELVFFVGGASSDLSSVTALLDFMGKKTVHIGPVGKAAEIKLLVNLMLAHAMTAFSETMKLGLKLGMNQTTLHNILLGMPVTAPFLRNIQDKLEQEDTSANFPYKWMEKDLGLVMKMAESNKTELAMTKTLHELFASGLANPSMGDQDFSSIYHLI